ncbi:MAG: hypothetical protein ACKOVA_07750 [Novosphingobium sp.]
MGGRSPMFSKSFLAAFGCAIAIACAGTATARSVALDSAVFVERTRDTSRILEPAGQLMPGDRVVTVLTWRRAVPGGQFTVANALPRGLYYQGSASDTEEVSIDGGRNWGKLGAMRTGGRLVTAEDVTHVRWRVQSGDASGRIAYSAIVR